MGSTGERLDSQNFDPYIFAEIALKHLFPESIHQYRMCMNEIHTVSIEWNPDPLKKKKNQM